MVEQATEKQDGEAPVRKKSIKSIEELFRLAGLIEDEEENEDENTDKDSNDSKEKKGDKIVLKITDVGFRRSIL